MKQLQSHLRVTVLSAIRRRGTLRERMFSLFDYKMNDWVAMRPFVIHPNSRFNFVWNVLSTAFILISVLYIPFELAFEYKTGFGGTASQAALHVLNPTMDLFFIVDIFVQFRVALLEDGELIQVAAIIAKHYLKSWFTLDFVSSASSIIVYITDVSGYKALRNVRLLRLARLLKLMRVAKLKQLLRHLDAVRTELRVVAKLVKLMVVSETTHASCSTMRRRCLTLPPTPTYKRAPPNPPRSRCVSRTYSAAVFTPLLM